MSFCALPFLHMAGKTTGSYRLCCNSSQSNIENVKKMGAQSFQDVWQAPYYQEVRSQMLKGQWPAACLVCKKHEELGRVSKRQSFNQYWEDKLGSEEFTKLKTNPQILSLDLRLGNLCNLKCNMCNSLTSSSFAKEWEHIQSSDFSHHQESHEALKYLRPWYEKESFWQDLREVSPRLESLYITGGEPTLIPAYLEYLDFLIENQLTNLELKLNTNLTIDNERFYDQLKNFNNLILMVSLDGFEEVNSYIRYPSKWSQIHTNLLKLKERNISFIITPTISAYNFSHLPQFIDWFVDNFEGKMDFNLLDEPEYHHLNVLPLNFREGIIKELEKRSNHSQLINLKESLRAFREKQNVEGFDLFKKYTKSLESYRNYTMPDMISELRDLIHE